MEARLRGGSARLKVERIGANVVARTELGRDRRIVLGGHLDTVPPNGNQQPRRDGDVLHGLGTADMKGGLAVLLALADDLSQRTGALRRHDRASTTAKRSPRSTTGCDGCSRRRRSSCRAISRSCSSRPAAGWKRAARARSTCAASFDGVRSHSARPWMGRERDPPRAPVLLDRCAAFEAATVDVDSLEYREALQVVRIEGGIANNVVPDHCALVVNRRYAPSRPLDDARGRGRVASAPTRARTTWTC